MRGTSWTPLAIFPTACPAFGEISPTITKTVLLSIAFIIVVRIAVVLERSVSEPPVTVTFLFHVSLPKYVQINSYWLNALNTMLAVTRSSQRCESACDRKYLVSVKLNAHNCSMPHTAASQSHLLKSVVANAAENSTLQRLNRIIY